MANSNGRVQQPVEVTPVVPVPEITPELVDAPMPAEVPERELPVVLPVLHTAMAADSLEGIDGLLLSGGGDIDPAA